MKEVKVGRLWGFKQCTSVSLALEQGSTKLQSFQAQNQYIWVLLHFPITFQILYYLQGPINSFDIRSAFVAHWKMDLYVQ